MKSEDDCFLGRKAMTNLDSVLKSRDIAVPAKVRIVKASLWSHMVVRVDYKEGKVPKN